MYTHHTSAPLQLPPWLPKSFQEDKSKEKKGSARMCAKSLQSCPTLCNPVDCSPPGSSVHEILQARILERVAMPSSRRSSWPRDWTCVLHFRQILYPLSHPPKKGRAPFKEPYFPLKRWRLDTGSHIRLEGSRDFINLLWDFSILVGKEFTLK